MLRYCIPLIPTAVFWWIMGVSDRYMVKWFLGSDANGIYAVAYKIPTILTILATVFMDAWQLSAIAESDGDRQVHLQFYGRIWDAFASAVFLGAGGIIALSPLLIRLLAEEAYYSAWQYIPVLTLSMAAAAFSNFMGSVYVVTKQSKASFWTSLVGAGSNIVLNLWLIPQIGLQGAAATFLSCLAVFLIRLVNARQLLPFSLSGRKLALGVGILLLQTPSSFSAGRDGSPCRSRGCWPFFCWDFRHPAGGLPSKVGIEYDRNGFSRLLHGAGGQRPRRDHRLYPGLL